MRALWQEFGPGEGRPPRQVPLKVRVNRPDGTRWTIEYTDPAAVEAIVRAIKALPPPQEGSPNVPSVGPTQEAKILPAQKIRPGAISEGQKKKGRMRGGS